MHWDQNEGSFDFGFLPANFRGDVQSWTNGNNAQGLYKWVKPRGVSMCYLVAIQGAGGGGGGFSGASTTARGGGGGGASSGMSILMCPAIFLPDNLSILVGNGGKGGSGSGQAGGAGKNSYIGYGAGINAITAIPNLILVSGASVPGGGGAGTGAAAGAAGGVPSTVSDTVLGHSGYLGFTKFLVGLVGLAGGVQTGAAGANVGSVWNVNKFSPGAGGAGVNGVNTGFIGGQVSLQLDVDWGYGGFIGPTNFIPGGVAGSAAAAGNGNPGINMTSPLFSCGGSGGGSSDGSPGGIGGNGGIGCGGGGGGAGVTGGAGGNGGDGAVIILSW